MSEVAYSCQACSYQEEGPLPDDYWKEICAFLPRPACGNHLVIN